MEVFKANLYYLDIREHRNMTNDPPYYTVYTAKPYELSIYVQDKMEFQGMIANIGLRWDLWDQNTKYNPNLYTPYYMSYVENDTVKTKYVGKETFSTKSPLAARLQRELACRSRLQQRPCFI